MIFEELLEEMEKRWDVVSPILPNANWIGLAGNFTPDELRTIANEIEQKFNTK